MFPVHPRIQNGDGLARSGIALTPGIGSPDQGRARLQRKLDPYVFLQGDHLRVGGQSLQGGPVHLHGQVGHVLEPANR